MHACAGTHMCVLCISKRKLLVARIGLTNDDVAPLELDGGTVEVIEQ